MSSRTANLLLLLAGAIWGLGFIAQRTAMDDLDPFYFIACRFLLGALAIAPFAIREWSRKAKQLTPRSLTRFSLLGGVFFLGMALQQWGLQTTTVTNAGFLTTTYVILVPAISLVCFRIRPPWFIWPAATTTLVGVYLLSRGSIQQFSQGDLFVIAGAAVWAVHVILVSRFAIEFKAPMCMSTIQFFTCSCLAFGAQAVLGSQSIGDFRLLYPAIPEIVYTGVFSGGIAFTLQAIGQRFTRPSIAAILMSSESLFAAILGAIFLGERLHLIGYVGCSLIAISIVIVECLQNEKPNEATSSQDSQMEPVASEQTSAEAMQPSDERVRLRQPNLSTNILSEKENSL